MKTPFPPRNGVSAKLKPKKQPAQRTPHALPITQRRAGTIQRQPDPESRLPKQPRTAYRPSNARLPETPHTRRHQPQPDLPRRTRILVVPQPRFIRRLPRLQLRRKLAGIPTRRAHRQPRERTHRPPTRRRARPVVEQIFHRATHRPQRRAARHRRMALRLPPRPTPAPAMGRMLARHRRGAA